MEFKTRNFTTGNTCHFKGLMPVICPFCGTTIEPTIIDTVSISCQSGKYYFTALTANCCNKTFLCIHDVTGTDGKFLTMYPSFVPDALPDSVHKISPRFVELYKQSNYAENQGFCELAGSGYRNALEVLIKDYAINILEEDESVVCGKKLYKVIEDYLPNVDLKTAGDVIRILGNDFTHYQRHYDISLSVFKKYLDIFIKHIDLYYLLKKPVVDVPAR